MDSMDSMKLCRQCRCRRPATQNICPCPVIQIVQTKWPTEDGLPEGWRTSRKRAETLFGICSRRRCDGTKDAPKANFLLDPLPAFHANPDLGSDSVQASASFERCNGKPELLVEILEDQM